MIQCFGGLMVGWVFGCLWGLLVGSVGFGRRRHWHAVSSLSAVGHLEPNWQASNGFVSASVGVCPRISFDLSVT